MKICKQTLFLTLMVKCRYVCFENNSIVCAKRRLIRLFLEDTLEDAVCRVDVFDQLNVVRWLNFGGDYH